MQAITRTRAIGGSLVVTIPKEIVREESLQENEVVEIQVKKIKKSGFGILKGMRPFTQKDKFKGQLEE